MDALSAILWMPLAAAVLILLLPASATRLIQGVAIAGALLTFVLSWNLLSSFDQTSNAMQFVEIMPWVPEMGMTYAIGVDGISLPMVLLTTLISLVALIASLTIKERLKAYFAWFLALEFAILGVFLAHDWFLFFIFFEISLIPMFFLIGVWGDKQRTAASMSFFLYTLAGSMLLLVGLIAAYVAAPSHSFSMDALVAANSGWSRTFQIGAFLACFIGFAVKIPAIPLHGWLPLAHVEAPVPVSMLLSAVLLKMGAYGLFRTAELFPLGFEALAPAMLALGLLNIVYGALMAWRETDLKSMVAYSSISHMGFVLVGMSSLTATGFSGAMMQMFTHGLVSAALFLLVGILYQRLHSRAVTDVAGLYGRMPVFTMLFTLALLASMGLPGLAGFISEFHALVGGYERWGLIVAIAFAGIIVTAAYSMRTINSMFNGSSSTKQLGLRDLSARELAAALPLAALIIGLGLIPGAAIGLISASTGPLSRLFR